MTGRRTGTTGVVVTLVLYVALIVLVLVFSRSLLIDLISRPSPVNPAVFVVAFAAPLFLLGAIIVALVRLLRERKRGVVGTGFRLRLIATFMVLIGLSVLPQALLSIAFLNTVTQSWLSIGFGSAIRQAQTTLLAVDDEEARRLESVAESRTYQAILSGVVRQPETVWRDLLAINPMLDAMQVVDAEGERFAVGDETLRIDPAQVRDLASGRAIRISGGDTSALYVIVVLADDLRVVLASRGVTGFERTVLATTGSLRAFDQLTQYQGVFVSILGATYVAFSIPLLLLAVLVSFSLSDTAIRPIANLEEATRRVAEGDFSYRILSRTHGEITSLVASFNAMVEELDLSRRRLLQTEKVAAWQEIAQRLAHEIKNPLTPIKLSAERLLRRYRTDPERVGEIIEGAVSSIVREVDGLSAMLSEFRNFSRMPPPVKRVVALRPILAETAETYFENTNVALHAEAIPEGATVYADANHLRQVFANLFKNAAEAMSGSGAVYVSIREVDKGRKRMSRIEVRDTGPGIPGEDIQRVFQPYVTTKEHGTGLGLAVVERIVFDHGGQIWVESDPGSGATFSIDLPTDDSNGDRRRQERGGTVDDDGSHHR